MQGLGFRIRIFPGTTRSAILLVVRGSHSPIALRLQLPNRYRNAEGERNESPLIKGHDWDNPPPLPDADWGADFVSDPFSLRPLLLFLASRPKCKFSRLRST